ncbi:tetratricopeptide repeat protein [Veronia pacifica]|uniref:Tetratricopeptide repeat protein n=1 Tax=Veronia pacifica TaxID=1080227 RepID=A0A1C3EDR9_9GAMM|nr:tetratricopeptide repeat protein [Veronia pacifica]ODA31391.1 hypothetical protein A8L45_17070 [Veronia pacifica]
MRGIWLLVLLLPCSLYAAEQDVPPVTFSDNLGLIRQELQLGNYQQALTLTDAATAKDAEQKAILATFRGRAYWGLGNIIEAQQNLLLAYQSRMLPPDYLRDTLKQLILISGERKMHRASAAFTSHYLRLEPDDVRYRLSYVRTLYKLDQCKKVLTHHDRLLQDLTEPTKDIWVIKAQCQEKLGLFTPLLNTLTAIESRYGLSVELKRSRARVYFKTKDYPRSYLIIRQVIASGKELIANDFLLMADSAYRSGNTEVAAEAINVGLSSRILETNRQNLKWLLKYQFESQQWREALKTANNLTSEPEMQVLKVKAQSALKEGEFTTCSDAAELAISIGASNDVALWKMAGYCAMKAGQYQQADIALREWQKRAPDSDASYWLSTLDVLKNRPAK